VLYIYGVHMMTFVYMWLFNECWSLYW